MSTAGLINRYIWFVTTIYNRGPISLTEIQNRFEAHFGRGEELGDRTFHRYKEAVMELFDIGIKYDRTRRGYVISDREGIDNMSMRKWLLQTFSVNSVLSESRDLKGRILLENIPSGQQHLTHIIEAMRESVALQITYHAFDKPTATTFEVEPWCVKLFEQRWYMLGKSKIFDQPRIYALDRIEALELITRKFTLPKKFDAEQFFANFFGVIINDKVFGVERVRLRVAAQQSNYLRTLPLHHSQIEVERHDDHSIFEYELCPTFDFIQKLLSMGGSVGVIAPKALRDILYIDGLAIATANNSEKSGTQ